MNNINLFNTDSKKIKSLVELSKQPTISSEVMQNYYVEEEELTIKELEELSKKYIELQKKLEELDNIDYEDNYSKEIYRRKIQEEINEIHSKLWRGIKLDESVLIPYIETVCTYLNQFGYNFEDIFKYLKDSCRLYVTNVDLIANGKLVTVDGKICIDCTDVEFEEVTLKYIGFKKENTDFFWHAIIHELFHTISNKINKQTVGGYDDAVSEGLTDLFAHKVSNKPNIKSNLYAFPTRIFSIFSKIVGDEKLFEDYITNFDTPKNILDLFNNCGCSIDDFRILHNKMNELLSLIHNKTNDISLVSSLKSEILNFIIEKIIKSNYFSLEEQQELINYINFIFSEKVDVTKIYEEMAKSNEPMKSHVK